MLSKFILVHIIAFGFLLYLHAQAMAGEAVPLPKPAPAPSLGKGIQHNIEATGVVRGFINVEGPARLNIGTVNHAKNAQKAKASAFIDGNVTIKNADQTTHTDIATLNAKQSTQNSAYAIDIDNITVDGKNMDLQIGSIRADRAESNNALFFGSGRNIHMKNRGKTFKATLGSVDAEQAHNTKAFLYTRGNIMLENNGQQQNTSLGSVTGGSVHNKEAYAVVKDVVHINNGKSSQLYVGSVYPE